jgi:5-methylcytosine-specific restriction endonuclease McrA
VRVIFSPIFDGNTPLLDRQVLVLNRLWQAVNVTTVRRAFTLLCQGHAQIVSAHGANNFSTHDFESWRDFSSREPESEMVHTISFKVRIPRVIVLLMFDRMPKKEIKFTRHNIFERDKNTCQYCARTLDRKELNLDHVLPRDKGGKTTWENIVCSCIRCNTRKANRLPHEVGMKLIKQPERPKWRPFLQFTFHSRGHGQPSSHGHGDWKHFLDVAYWNVELGDG